SRNNQAVGYGVGRVDSPSVLQRNSVSLGPIGANAPDALDATTAMIRWAASQRPEVLWQVFIANPTLPLLLDHGLRIDYLASYLSTETDLFDPACYSPSDFVL
ncbi:MAG: hypothetical protein ACREP9_16355, partial [Candidatus Dormibacteraceae bacterium]